ncbi:MAG: hypothetical protein U0271_27010 [Polyangiaceae bacterium]
MAICGPNLYQDDVAMNTRNTYLELVDGGLAPSDAVAQLVERDRAVLASDEAFRCPFWLAVADTMHSRGELVSHVRDAALEIIDSNADLALWSDDDVTLKTARAEVLRRLRDALTSTRSPKKRATRLRRMAPPWSIGEVLAWERPDGRLMLLHFFAMVKDAPVFFALDWIGTDTPPLDVIRELPAKPSKNMWKFTVQMPEAYPASEASVWRAEVEPRFRSLDIHLPSHRTPTPNVLVPWRGLTEYLDSQYDWPCLPGSL